MRSKLLGRILTGYLVGVGLGLSPSHLFASESLSAVWWGSLTWTPDGASYVFMESKGSVAGNEITEVIPGNPFSLALRANGTVFSWGLFFGPTVPPDLKDVQSLRYRGGLAAALKSNGTVVTWRPLSIGMSTPAGITNVTAIAAGYNHVVALKSDGTLTSWGLGGGMTGFPEKLTEVTAIAAGESFSAALRRDGTVVLWGEDHLGPASAPDTFRNVIRMLATDHCLLVMRADGSTAGWGFPASMVPARVRDVTDFAVGWNRAAALSNDGTVETWNDNSGAPVSLTNVVDIDAFGDASFAVRSDGSVVHWGPRSEVPRIASEGVSRIVAGPEVTVALGKPTPPRLVLQPSSQSVPQWREGRLEVEARGFGLTYQWMSNSLPQVRGTNAEFQVHGLSVGHRTGSMGPFEVVVSSPKGESVRSDPATLTILPYVVPGTVVEWGDDRSLLRTPPEEIQCQVVAAGTETSPRSRCSRTAHESPGALGKPGRDTSPTTPGVSSACR